MPFGRTYGPATQFRIPRDRSVTRRRIDTQCDAWTTVALVYRWLGSLDQSGSHFTPPATASSMKGREVTENVHIRDGTEGLGPRLPYRGSDPLACVSPSAPRAPLD